MSGRTSWTIRVDPRDGGQPVMVEGHEPKLRDAHTVMIWTADGPVYLTFLGRVLGITRNEPEGKHA